MAMNDPHYQFLGQAYHYPLIRVETDAVWMRDRPNIVLIVLDTLRADHVGCYSYHRDTTPNIDRFSRESTLFSNAYAPSYWTLPSHASLFTGLYPSEHGTSHKHMFLDDSIKTLAQELKAIGYSTISISSNLFIRPEFGMTRGFDVAEHPMDLPYYSTTDLRKVFKDNKGKDIVIQFLKELKHSDYKGRDILNFFYAIYKGNKPSLKSEWSARAHQLFRRLQAHSDRIKDQPFFLFMNFMECHYAYSPKEEFAKRFIPDFSKEHLAIGSEHPWSRIANPPDEFTVDLLNRLYDAELAYADKYLGMIMKDLESKGLLNDSIVIVTSDHGELFGEQDLFGHPPSMHNKLLHVPLIVRYPTYFPKGKTIDRRVSIAGIYNCLQSILGVEFSNDSIISSILPRSREGSEKEEPVFAETLGFRANLEKYGLDQADFDKEIQALHLDSMKIIHHEGTFTVYDLNEDPMEERPLDLDADRTEELRSAFKQFRERLNIRAGKRKQKEMDKDIKANLEALGYL